MGDRVRVGVVGTSWWADMMHLPVLKIHSGASIQAICGRNQERAGEMAEKYAVPQVYSDYRDMIAHGGLDAVVIAVPDDLHFPIAMAALDAGLHVLCEKPMAFTLDQARKMLSKAEAARVKHMVYFTWRWAPYVQTLLHQVKNGYIGRCYDVQIHYIGGYARGAGYQWKWDREHGLGVLGDLGSHMIDLSHLLVGEISKVHASLSVRDPKAHGEISDYERANDSATLIVQFSNGATGTIFTSAVAAVGSKVNEQKITLYGEDGTLGFVADLHRYAIRGIRNPAADFEDLPVPDEFLAGSDRDDPSIDQLMRIFSTQPAGVRLFIDSILEDKAVSPGFLDGVKVQAVIEAAFESDRSGCWVEVDPGKK